MALGFFEKLSTIGDKDPLAAGRALQAQDAETNYLSNPAQTIQDVGAIPGQLPQAMSLRNDQQTQAANATAVQQQQDAAKTAAFGQVVSALRGAHAAGANVSDVYDQLVPTLTQHGATAADIASWKPLLTGPNGPAILEAMDQKRQDALDKIVSIPGNGGGIYDPRAAQAGGSGIVATTAQKPTVVAPGAAYVPGAPGTGGPVAAVGTRAGAGATNPGAIKDGAFAKAQPGYSGPDASGFATFATPQAGIAAQEALLGGPSYVGGGVNTVNSIVDKYLGKGDAENSPASRANYKMFVAQKLGVDPAAPLPANAVPAVAAAMRGFENVGGGGAASAGQAAVPGAPAGSFVNNKPEVRAASPQEIAAAGYPVGTAAQVDSTGKFINIKTPTGKAAAVDPTTQYNTAKDALSELKQNLIALRDDPGLGAATGIEGHFTRNIPGTHAQSLESQLGQIQSQKLVALIQALKQNGVSAFGRVTNNLAKMLPQTLAPLSFSQNTGDFKNNINKGLNQLNMLQQRLDEGYKNTVGRTAAPAANNFKPGPNGVLIWQPGGAQ